MITISNALKFTVLGAALALAACTTKPEAETAAPPPVASNGPVNAAPLGSNIIPGSAEDLRVNVGDTIHFGLDRYDVEDADRALLQRQAQWLARYPNVRVTLEGHADERGTREYNLALGARRANAAKEFLVSLGVASGRVETVSYGKERPVCAESNDSCWAQNRRAVTVVASGAAS